MAIIRYTASADNTITNAYTETIIDSQRATGSNSGKSDVLEVFSIYGQHSSSVGPSSEASRILIKFDTAGITKDRAMDVMPSTGVKFYLCMYNAPHGSTLPEDYKLTVARVTNDWEEGYGLDLANYSDKTYDGVGSNWVNANGSFVSASATLKLAGDTNLASLHGQTFDLIDSDGTSQTFTIDYNSGTTTGGTVGFGAPGTDQNDNAMAAIKAAINSISALDIEATTITAVGDATSEHTLLIKQKTAGFAGNTAIDVSGVTGLTVDGSTSAFTGGSGKWETVGGDFTVATANDFIDVSFPDGDEDIKVDITTIVDKWLLGAGGGGYDNYGLMIKLTSSQEPYYTPATSATGSQNTGGSKRSFYTKRFFARGTEYFFKRPVIEARWNDSRNDQRGSIYLSSSYNQHAAYGALEMNNTIYVYNYNRGRLTDVNRSSALASHEGSIPVCKIYKSADGVTPSGFPLKVFQNSTADQPSAGSERVERGTYKASFVIKEEQMVPDYPYLVDVWFHNNIAMFTGSLGIPKRFEGTFANPTPEYVVAIPNLKKTYNPNEKPRFRVAIREKDWSPTVYSVASKQIELAHVPSASYEIFRVIDGYKAIPYGQLPAADHVTYGGSYDADTGAHTMMSVDKDGNYFDLDMNLLEPGYSYGIRISINDGLLESYQEQPYEFKFKVRKDEY